VTTAGRTYFTSDHHFGHKKIVEYSGRPFSSTEEMDAEMVRRWNARVRPEDTVYHLGDFSFGSLDDIIANVRRLNGRKILIVGNHDFYHFRRGSRASDWTRAHNFFLAAGFAEVAQRKALWFQGVAVVLLTHVPVFDATEVNLHEGANLNLCGHVHEHWARRGHCINVGVDVRDFEPKTLEELLS
jgi:calcineurin-like phosphoesterase family protein